MQFLPEITLIKRIIALFMSYAPLIGRVGQLYTRQHHLSITGKRFPFTVLSTAISNPESSDLRHSNKVNHSRPEIIFEKSTSGNTSVTTITAGECTAEELRSASATGFG